MVIFFFCALQYVDESYFSQQVLECFYCDHKFIKQGFYRLCSKSFFLYLHKNDYYDIKPISNEEGFAPPRSPQPIF